MRLVERWYMSLLMCNGFIYGGKPMILVLIFRGVARILGEGVNIRLRAKRARKFTQEVHAN